MARREDVLPLFEELDKKAKALPIEEFGMVGETKAHEMRAFQAWMGQAEASIPSWRSCRASSSVSRGFSCDEPRRITRRHGSIAQEERTSVRSTISPSWPRTVSSCTTRRRFRALAE